MAKKQKAEEAPKGSPAWMSTFSDLMNLLMCFFVLLFSMSSTDESKAEAMIKSLADSFSIFQAGGESFEDGVLIASGSTQLSNLDEYFTSSGQTADGTDEENPNHDSSGQQTSGDKVGQDDKSESTNGNTQSDQSSQGNEGQEANPGNEGQETNPGQTDVGQNQNNKDPNSGTSGSNQQQDAEKGDEKDKDKDKENPAQLTPEQIAELAAADNLSKNKLETGDLFEDVIGLTDKNNLGDYVKVVLDNEAYEYVQIDVSGSVLFNSSSATIKKESESVISRLGDVLSQFKDYKIEIIGHTDNVPMAAGSQYKSNEELSCARAITIAEYLADTKNMGWSNIYYSGRGEHEPIASNATAEGRAQNRRVEIRLYNKRSSK